MLLFTARTVGRTVIFGDYHGRGTDTNVTNPISLSDSQNIRSLFTPVAQVSPDTSASPLLQSVSAQGPLLPDWRDECVKGVWGGEAPVIDRGFPRLPGTYCLTGPF